MDPTEAADQIRESLEEERQEQRATEQFRSRAALLIAVLAMLLAVTSLAGGNVTEDMINSNIQASDAWAFYQAKNVRQTANELAADGLEAQLKLQGAGANAAARREVQALIAKYRATAARYESEPDPTAPNDPLNGDGKEQLRAQAEAYGKARDRAQQQDPNFDYAEALFQIAIVLGSVAILATSRPVLIMSVVLGAVATVLMFNGFFLFMKLPF